jgi:hypothetical protein
LVDEMTGDRSAHAISRRTSPTERMGFPYSAVQAWLGVGCDGVEEWAYVGFSGAPNLTGTTSRDGHDTFRTRVRWDDQAETMEFRQDWGDSFIHFQNHRSAIAKLANASRLVLELNWYGEGRVYFRFSLAGSSAALAEARAACQREGEAAVTEAEAKVVGHGLTEPPLFIGDLVS